MITLIKKYSNKTSASRITLDELVEMIRNQKYGRELQTYREVWPLKKASRMDDERCGLELCVEEPKSVPRVCVAAEWQKREGKMTRVAYNGLVMLEVNNLKDTDEAIGLRFFAGRQPQTLLAFVGAEGRSVVIICRAELYPDCRREGNALPTEEEQIRRFHYNAYAAAQKFYTAQLELTVDVLEPRLDRTCLLSADVALCYNPDAIPFYADDGEPLSLVSPYQPTATDADLLPGRSLAQTQHILVQHCLRKAFEDSAHIDDEDEYRVEVLTHHAQYCMEAGVPKALALRLTLFSPNLGRDALLAESIFDNAYNPKAMRRLLKRNATGGVSLRPIPESALLILRTKVFMDQNYEFRKNVLTRVTQYRELSQPDFDFQDVTQEVRNSMTTKAMLAGLKSWDRDIKRYIESNDIPQYDPIEDYLSHLPAWDGTDRVTTYAQLVPTDDALWQRFFPVWMRSMVAHWLGKDRSHGNALMPLLIGPQGSGKSTFCGKVLPPELTPYYNDRVNFKNEFDLLNQLSSYALINVDEFDSIGASRQPLLKYLLSKPDVKLRVPYGKSISNRRRYASFIATTNQQLPLTDPTGARRFLCVNVAGRIDTESPVDYAQLYAQLLAEVQSGLRYWLTDEETAEVIAHNEQFRQLDSIEEMVRSLFRKPKSGDTDAVILPVTKIVSILRERFPGVQANRATFIKVGKILVSMGCEGHRGSSGNAYQVVVQEK